MQLDYDEDMVPLYGMYGSMDAEFEIQRTIKRAELTAYVCFLKRLIGPIKVHVDNKGIIEELRKGERVYQAKSGRCRIMHTILRGITWSGRKRHFG